MAAFDIAPSPSRVELRTLFLEQRRAIDRVLERADNPQVSAVQLIELIEAVEQVDERKSQLMRALREEASDLRKREEERSVRQFVLQALDYVGVPQPAGFLQEFVWARERVDLNTRGFGALRRDEARAWKRRPAHRMAYIIPALTPDGQAQARWMARSDWPLAGRLVVPGAERLFGLKRLVSLFRARDETPGEPTDPYLPLIRRHAPEILEEINQPPLRTDGNEAAWLETVRRTVQSELSELEAQVEQTQEEAASRIAGWTQEEQLWGR